MFNNWAAFWNGSFISVNQLDGAALEKIIRRAQP
ncbi:MAG: YoaP domain-containing protein [Oscillospiraceae bacterium]